MDAIYKNIILDSHILYKINSKQIIELNLRARTETISGENIRSLWPWTKQRVLRYDTKSTIH